MGILNIPGAIFVVVSQQTIKQGCDLSSRDERKKERKLNGQAWQSLGSSMNFCWGVLNQRKKTFACRTEGKKKESVCMYV